MLIYSKFRQTQLDAPTSVCSIGSCLPIPTNDGYTYVKPSQLFQAPSQDEPNCRWRSPGAALVRIDITPMFGVCHF
ncbi:hypothetical protein [Chamaesiphon polymorphus]|uniref:Uncharacterized protein n=1 Tax=Chamaesiphon polymorphus CCALA 037 TaxID=2107692 RepID=A0A2T1GM76_9CYAN|nr:hypothetical protein [Chamaesiphon polymorphus]PSB58999.1 hypothetical protein C7B77_02560 [Chamaesiphon polymorphus CCALA 037]